MRSSFCKAAICLLLLLPVSIGAPMKALIIDGQNNHDWKSTTPHLKHRESQHSSLVNLAN